MATRTAEGDSAESEPSEEVRPNEPLPEGWTETFDKATGKVRGVCSPVFTERACVRALR